MQSKEIQLISHKYNLKNSKNSNNMLKFVCSSIASVLHERCRAHDDNLAEAHHVNVSRKREDGFKSDI